MAGQGEIMKYSVDYRKKQIAAFDQITKAQLDNLRASTLRQGRQSDLLSKEISIYELGKIGQIAPGFVNILRSIFGR